MPYHIKWGYVQLSSVMWNNSHSHKMQAGKPPPGIWTFFLSFLALEIVI